MVYTLICEFRILFDYWVIIYVFTNFICKVISSICFLFIRILFMGCNN